MNTKRIISLILIIVLIFSSSASIYADSIGDSLKNIRTSQDSIVKETVKKFKDMKDSDWFAESVSMLYKLGIIDGKPQKDNTVIFDPKGLVTKSEFTKMLVVAMEYDLVDGNTFNDIGYDRHWAKKYIETAVKEGVINPEKEGENYWPDIPIKRFDMAMMMFKALKFEYSDNPTPFPDVDCGCMTKLYEEYLINGSPDGDKVYFKPSGLTTRAEAAATIARLIEYREDPEAYKAKKLAEIKEKEFIEPEIVVENMNPNERGKYFVISIKNYTDYNNNFKFKIECLNHKEVNKAEILNFGIIDCTQWRDYKFLNKMKGYLFDLSYKFYTTKDLIDKFKIEDGMQFDFKVTITNGKVTKEYPISAIARE